MARWYCYSRAIEVAPAVTSGPSSTNTTAAGGQTTSGPSSTSTTAAGGQTTSGPSSSTTTASGGATTSGPSSSETTADGGGIFETESGIQINQPGGPLPGIDNTAQAGLHDHGINNGTVLVDKDGGWHVWVASGNHFHQQYGHGHAITVNPHKHSMEHTHSIGPHSHGMDHTHQIAAHTHGMDHTHEISGHTHGMDHTHEIPSHTHAIQYGVFEGPTPSAITVKVDGTMIPAELTGTSVQDLDIIPYLSKDGGGKVRRGWHTVEIIPNDLGRIVANINSQIFVNSRGGGDY